MALVHLILDIGVGGMRGIMAGNIAEADRSIVVQDHPGVGAMVPQDMVIPEIVMAMVSTEKMMNIDHEAAIEMMVVRRTMVKNPLAPAPVLMTAMIEPREKAAGSEMIQFKSRNGTYSLCLFTVSPCCLLFYFPLLDTTSMLK